MCKSFSENSLEAQWTQSTIQNLCPINVVSNFDLLKRCWVKGVIEQIITTFHKIEPFWPEKNYENFKRETILFKIVRFLFVSYCWEWELIYFWVVKPNWDDHFAFQFSKFVEDIPNLIFPGYFSKFIYFQRVFIDVHIWCWFNYECIILIWSTLISATRSINWILLEFHGTCWTKHFLF